MSHFSQILSFKTLADSEFGMIFAHTHTHTHTHRYSVIYQLIAGL